MQKRKKKSLLFRIFHFSDNTVFRGLVAVFFVVFLLVTIFSFINPYRITITDKNVSVLVSEWEGTRVSLDFMNFCMLLLISWVVLKKAKSVDFPQGGMSN